jgi:hypothetical protein
MSASRNDNMPLRATCLVAAGLLLASAEPFTDPAVVVWLRLAEFGFLGAFCWYGISKALPRMLKQFQDEAERSRAHYSGIIDKLVERMEKDRAADRDTVRNMIQHCSAEAKR